MKLEAKDLGNLKISDLERSAARAVFLGLHHTPGFRLADFLRQRTARRYAQSFSNRWLAEQRKVIARLVERAAIDLGLEREKVSNVQKLEALALVERLARVPIEELSAKVEELGELPETGLALVLQAARLGVTP